MNLFDSFPVITACCYFEHYWSSKQSLWEQLPLMKQHKSIESCGHGSHGGSDCGQPSLGTKLKGKLFVHWASHSGLGVWPLKENKKRLSHTLLVVTVSRHVSENTLMKIRRVLQNTLVIIKHVSENRLVKIRHVLQNTLVIIKHVSEKRLIKIKYGLQNRYRGGAGRGGGMEERLDPLFFS